MPNANTKRRPYAPASSVLAVIARARTRILPDVVNTAFLNVSGVSGQSVSRTKDALHFLGLTDESGAPTDAFRKLSNAPDQEISRYLREVVESAYHEELALIDPGQDDPAKIKGVFQRYDPKSTTTKMVSLFLALCAEAGMEVQDPPATRKRNASTQRKKMSTESTDQNRKGVPKTEDSTGEPPSIVVPGISEIEVCQLSKTEFETLWQHLGTLVWLRAHQSVPDDGKSTRLIPSRTTLDR